MSSNMNEPIIVTGVYGWRDETGPTSTSYSVYGPDGRWGNDRQGHHMADALEEAGVSEGAKLVVVALPRFCDVKAEDVVAHLDLLLGETEECTGLTAAWCPRCPTLVTCDGR